MRQQLGNTTAAVAGVAGVDRTLLTRIETGQRRVKVDQIMRIVEALGIAAHTDRWQELYALARDADSSGWWDTPRFKEMGPRQILPADLEAGASRIRTYEFILVPGLLQSPAYVRARHDAKLTSSVAFDPQSAIRGRLRRQEEAFRPGGPRIEVVIEEIVIRRLLVPPEAMLEQLQHLLMIMDTRPQVELRILPVGGELIGEVAPRSPWTLFDFATGDPRAVAVESLTDDALYRDRPTVDFHERMWSIMRRLALSAEETRALITDAAEALTQRTATATAMEKK